MWGTNVQMAKGRGSLEGMSVKGEILKWKRKEQRREGQGDERGGAKS